MMEFPHRFWACFWRSQVDWRAFDIARSLQRASTELRAGQTQGEKKKGKTEVAVAAEGKKINPAEL